jgi:tripartite ATP-independent transporter DctP family solute receptor
MRKLSVLLLLAFIFVFTVGCAAPATEDNKTADSTAVTTTASAPATTPAAQAKVLKFGTANAKSRAPAQAITQFAELVGKYSNGTIKVEVYTDSVLGDDQRLLEGLQMGSVQGAQVATGAIAGFAPEIGIFDLPFLFKDKATAYKTLDGDLGTQLLKNLEAKGFVGLAYWENGFRHLTNSKREVTALADIKGLKIRTMQSQISVDSWKALGANPTPMAWSQTYTALEEKVVDGQENPVGNVVSNKLYEVQKFLTLDGHVYSAQPMMISKKFWDTLSDAEKDALKKAAKEATDIERKMVTDEDNAALKTIKDAGMTVSELKDGEKQKMRDAEKTVYDTYGKNYGADLMAKMIEATK